MRKLLLAILLWAGSASFALAQVCPAGSTCATLDSYNGAHLSLGGALSLSGSFTTTLTVTGNTALTLPTTGTLATLAGSESFSNKTYAGGALSGTFSGAPTVSGNLTFSGVPLFTGLSAGTQTKCLGLDVSNNLVYTAAACGSGAGTGTVTSVDFSVPATSIFAISGNPVTTSGTLALTTTGTSGGIPYFSSGSALSTSAALTASRLVLGGGAGAAPTVLGSLGTTTTLLHGNAAGAPTFGAVSLTADVSGIAPVANGGTGIASGTSGGVLAYTASGTLASSGALTANLPVIGGGAGVAPSVGTRSGNTTAYVTTTGAQTSGDCVKIDASGNHVANGSACGSGGSVSITAATPNIVVTPSPITGTGTVGTTVTLDTQSGNSGYTVVSGDNTKAVSRTNTVTQTDIIPQATGSFASGFSFGYSTATVGNTLTATTSTVNGITGATGIKVGAQQEIGCNSDGTNWACLLGLPQPATQTGTTYLADDMSWKTTPVGANPSATIGTSAVNGAATTFMRSDAAPAVPAASTSTAGIAKLHNVPVSLGWVAAVNPNNTVIAVINQASTVSAIVGAVETATGSAATVTINKAGSGTACSAGTALHSGTFNANGTAATNQTLTVTTASLSAGDRLCLQTTGTTSWAGGTGIGTVTVFLAPS